MKSLKDIGFGYKIPLNKSSSSDLNKAAIKTNKIKLHNVVINYSSLEDKKKHSIKIILDDYCNLELDDTPVVKNFELKVDGIYKKIDVE